MRIIVWGINYAPELTGIGPFNTGLCEYLVERGHQVEIATTFPYYPFWQKIPGDRGRLYRTDQIDAVQVHRCWHYVPGKATTLRRIWHELSFALTSFVRVLFLARPDVYLVVSPPLALGPLASIMAWLKRRPYFFHVQDLQPDAAVGLGMVQAGQFTRLLYRLESWAYRDAAVVSGISEGMRRAFLSKGVPESKCVLFPNWLRTVASNVDYRLPEQERGAGSRAFRGKFGIPPAAFVASYSGNLGRKQGLESLVEAAAILRRDQSCGSEAAASDGPKPDIVILLIGDGVMKQVLQDRISASGVERYIRMLPLLLERDYRDMLMASDVCLVTQAPGTGQYFFPSKLLSVLAAGTLVLSVADCDSELARAVDEGRFGVNVVPGNPQALADKLRELAENPAPLTEMRIRTSWVRRFSASHVLGAFEQRLRETVETKPG